MDFFFLNKDAQFDIFIHGTHKSKSTYYKFDLKAPPKEALESGQISFKNVYVSTNMHIIFNKRLNDMNMPGVVRVYGQEGKDQILSHHKFPKYIGNVGDKGFKFTPLEEKMKQFQGKDSFKLGIFSSSALGDMIIAFNALALLYKELNKYFQKVEIDVFLEDSLNYIQLIAQQSSISNVYQEPVTLDKLCQYDAYIDMDRILNDEKCRELANQPMIDMYLDALSLDKNTIPDKDKRSSIKLSDKISGKLQDIFQKLKSNNKKILMFHPKSSELRSIPPDMIPEILDKIIQKTDYIVISAIKTEYQNPRFYDLSDFSTDFNHYAYIISQSDFIITVDTSVYHVADSFNIPTVVLFTSINPEYRVKYYPYTEGILLSGDDTRILGKHLSIDKDELEYAASLFKNLDIQPILDKVTRLSDNVRSDKLLLS
jgi:ADP-heptose:LPS heptosyltransferase